MQFVSDDTLFIFFNMQRHGTISSEPIVLDRLEQRSDAPGHWRARDLLPPTGLREHL